MADWSKKERRQIRLWAIQDILTRAMLVGMILTFPVWLVVGVIVIGLKEWGIPFVGSLPGGFVEAIKGTKKRSTFYLALFPNTLERRPKSTFRNQPATKGQESK